MARIEVRMPGAEGVSPGNTAIFKLPVGRRFHELQLAYSGVTLAQMTEIRVLVNGKPIHRYPATVRDVMNQFDGREAANGILVIPFDRYGLKNRAGEEETALNTDSVGADGRKIGSLTVEIVIHPDATAPVLSMNATQSERLEGGPGSVMHVMHFPRTAGGAGELQVSDLPFGMLTSQALNRVFIKPSAGTIDKVILERDTYTIWEREAALNSMMQQHGIRVPQAGWFVIDKSEKGYGGDPVGLVGFHDFRYRLECSAAATVDFHVEYLGALGD